MALVRHNTAEGGTADLTLVTPGNSGGSSGDAFDTVDYDYGSSMRFNNDTEYEGDFPLIGTWSYRLYTGQLLYDDGRIMVAWTGLGPLAHGTYSVCLRMTGYPSDEYYSPDSTQKYRPLWLAFQNGATGSNAFVQITDEGLLEVVDANDDIVATSNDPIPLDQWYRLDLRVLVDPDEDPDPLGEVELGIFYDYTSGSPDETVLVSPCRTNGMDGGEHGTGVERAMYGNWGGVSSRIGGDPLFAWMDELKVYDEAYTPPSGGTGYWGVLLS